MSKKFTDLPSKATAATGDLVAIWDNAAAVNKQTPVSGLASAVASSLPAASVKASNIDFTTFGQIQTFSNPGNAAGTVYYQVNTATGVKEAWGTTPAATVNASTVLLNINLPAGFFTSIKSSLASPINATGNADINIYPQSCTTTNFAVYAFGKSSGNTVCISFYVRGV